MMDGDFNDALTGEQKIRNFNGKIDELTLFGDALSPAEIQSLYTDGRL